MLQGFKQYFRGKQERIPHGTGLTELRRLEKGHFLLAIPAEHERAWDFVSGRDGLRHISSEMIVTAEQVSNMSKTAKDTIVIVPIPKRWFTKPQLEAKGIKNAIGEFIPLGDGWKLPHNHVWGYFSKWDEDREESVEPGQFYRNRDYHGHDKLYNIWKTKYGAAQPTAVRYPPSRLPTPHSPHGYQYFHGYNDVEFSA
jgi:hypothetical protein